MSFLKHASGRLQETGITLKVVGDMPPDLQEQLGKQYPHIKTTGPVENFDEHIRDCRLGLIIDEVGGGFKLKSLDYAFYGIPIFTLAGAMEGTPLNPDEDFFSETTYKGLAERIPEIIDNGAKLRSVRHSAYQKCRAHFDWDHSAVALLNGIGCAKRK